MRRLGTVVFLVVMLSSIPTANASAPKSNNFGGAKAVPGSYGCTGIGKREVCFSAWVSWQRADGRLLARLHADVITKTRRPFRGLCQELVVNDDTAHVCHGGRGRLHYRFRLGLGVTDHAPDVISFWAGKGLLRQFGDCKTTADKQRAECPSLGAIA